MLAVERCTLQNTNKTGQATKGAGIRKTHGFGVTALALLSLATVPAALAQTHTLTVIANFNGTNGELPESGLTLSRGRSPGFVNFDGSH